MMQNDRLNMGIRVSNQTNFAYLYQCCLARQARVRQRLREIAFYLRQRALEGVIYGTTASTGHAA